MKPTRLPPEFTEFLSTRGEQPPQGLSQSILQNVYLALNPPLKRVLGKLAVVQFFSGAVTLFFCPQFGVGPLGGGHGLMHWFMQWGDFACALGCGSVFFGVSALVVPWVLSREERRVVCRHGLWQLGLIGTIGMFALMLVGGRGTPLTGFDWTFALTWLIGGTAIFQVINIISLFINGRRLQVD